MKRLRDHPLQVTSSTPFQRPRAAGVLEDDSGAITVEWVLVTIAVLIFLTAVLPILMPALNIYAAQITSLIWLPIP